MSLNAYTRKVIAAEVVMAEENVEFFLHQYEVAEDSLKQINNNLHEATKRRDELKASLEEES